MMRSTHATFLLILILNLLVYNKSVAQLSKFKYAHDISVVNDTFHKVEIPLDIIGEINGNENQLRLFGITDENDTIEVPYILNKSTDYFITEKVEFTTLNQVYRGKKFYVTFECPSETEVNHISFDFIPTNFDWYTDMEGSQDQSTWYTVTERQRLVSIENIFTTFKYTSMNFQPVKYRYLRFKIQSDIRPEYRTAVFYRKKIVKGEYESIPINYTIENQNDGELTIIYININRKLPVNRISLKVANQHDYYRNVSFWSFRDSLISGKMRQAIYNSHHSSVLSSLDSQEFEMPSEVINDRFKIVINNYDDEPLAIEDIKFEGAKWVVHGRFSGTGKYFLAYGNEEATAPHYDLERFKNKMPSDSKFLKLGERKVISESVQSASGEPMFMDRMWLWIVMGAIILVLGIYSISMFKSK